MSKLNREMLSDRLYLWGLRARHKPAFHGGLDSPALADHLQVLDVELPELPGSGRVPCEVTTLMGQVRMAVSVQSLAPPTEPVLIFHHDFGDSADEALRRAFRHYDGPALTVIGVEAPFHGTHGEAMSGLVSLMAYLTMLAAPVAVTEKLLEFGHLAQAPVRAVAGFGQGGYISNLHHMIYNSAEVYVPFMAGAAPAEVFLNALPTAGAVRRKPAKLRQLLNFDEAWRAHAHPNVFPVLGSADLINRFDAQARSYGDTPIEVWNASHMETMRHPERLRQKIVRHIRDAMRADNASAA